LRKVELPVPRCAFSWTYFPKVLFRTSNLLEKFEQAREEFFFDLAPPLTCGWYSVDLWLGQINSWWGGGLIPSDDESDPLATLPVLDGPPGFPPPRHARRIGRMKR